LKILHIITILGKGSADTIIIFIIHLVPAEVAHQLRNARNCLTTSFVEGTPAALLEAMACALVVVTSKSNVYDELIKAGKMDMSLKDFKLTIM